MQGAVLYAFIFKDSKRRANLTCIFRKKILLKMENLKVLFNDKRGGVKSGTNEFVSTS
jgi:hypothetical protein